MSPSRYSNDDATYLARFREYVTLSLLLLEFVCTVLKNPRLGMEFEDANEPSILYIYM